MSGEHIIIVIRMKLRDPFSIYGSIRLVTLPLSSQRTFLTIEASVGGERSSKLPDFSRQP